MVKVFSIYCPHSSQIRKRVQRNLAIPEGKSVALLTSVISLIVANSCQRPGWQSAVGSLPNTLQIPPLSTYVGASHQRFHLVSLECREKLSSSQWELPDSSCWLTLLVNCTSKYNHFVQTDLSVSQSPAHYYFKAFSSWSTVWPRPLQPSSHLGFLRRLANPADTREGRVLSAEYPRMFQSGLDTALGGEGKTACTKG